MKKQLHNKSFGVTGVTSLSVCRIPHHLSPSCAIQMELFQDSFSSVCWSMGGITPGFPWHVLELTASSEVFQVILHIEF